MRPSVIISLDSISSLPWTAAAAADLSETNRETVEGKPPNVLRNEGIKKRASLSDKAPMSSQTLVIADAFGAALLAIWPYVRFESRTPDTRTTVLHAACVFLVIAFLPAATDLVAGDGDSLLRRFASNFIVVVPGLTYIWLSSIWVLLVAVRGGHLRY
jgi:hypothetical protein